MKYVGETGIGWNKVIQPVIDQAKIEGADIVQIKEKFGGLRIYCHNTSENLRKKIQEAVWKSEETCENCGKEGCQKAGGWIKTLCNDCEKVENWLSWYV